MLTPLVIAMPKPMAQALGWPDTPIGYADLLKLAQDPNGWAAKGHPEWGKFKLGKTNPNFSTSALAATTAQNYAASAKVRDLSLEDLNRPEVQAFNRAVESSVVHYGDITLTFLDNWYRNDRRGTSLTYVSAVAVEEKSVIDYNRGNPDGITQPGEVPKAAEGAARRRVPEGRHVLLGQPVLRPRRAVGDREAEGRGGPLRRVRAAAGQPEADPRNRLPAGQPGGSGGLADHRAPTASIRDNRRPRSASPRPPCW